MKLEKQFLKINKKMKQKMARGPSEWPSLRGELSRDFCIPGRYDHEGTMAEHEATALRPHQAAGGVGQRCDCRTRVGQDKSHHEHPKSLEKGLFGTWGKGLSHVRSVGSAQTHHLESGLEASALSRSILILKKTNTSRFTLLGNPRKNDRTDL